MKNGMSEFTLDAGNMLCPMPVIKTQNKINELANGDVLKVTCTDPGALSDIPAWCRINGHSVVNTAEINEIVTVTVLVNK